VVAPRPCLLTANDWASTPTMGFGWGGTIRRLPQTFNTGALLGDFVCRRCSRCGLDPIRTYRLTTFATDAVTVAIEPVDVHADHSHRAIYIRRSVSRSTRAIDVGRHGYTWVIVRVTPLTRFRSRLAHQPTPHVLRPLLLTREPRNGLAELGFSALISRAWGRRRSARAAGNHDHQCTY
jgi:hypothetical protein